MVVDQGSAEAETEADAVPGAMELPRRQRFPLCTRRRHELKRTIASWPSSRRWRSCCRGYSPGDGFMQLRVPPPATIMYPAVDLTPVALGPDPAGGGHLYAWIRVQLDYPAYQERLGCRSIPWVLRTA